MRRFPVAVVAIALALAGCPLPQPLPTYPAGTITPPRILAATTTSGVASIIPVPANCATAPSYPLDARLWFQESVTGEKVEARWFVDYKTGDSNRSVIRNTIRDVPADPDPAILERQVPTYVFAPYDFPVAAELVPSGTQAPANTATGVVHVVELVVSNGFEPPPGDASQANRLPGKTPDGASQFEIQTYRWMFVNVPEDPAAPCSAGAVGCPKCPP